VVIVEALLAVAQAALVAEVAHGQGMAVVLQVTASVRARGDLLALLAQVALQLLAVHALMRMVLAVASVPAQVQQDLHAQLARGAHRADRVLAVIVQRVQDAQAVVDGLAVQDDLLAQPAQQEPEQAFGAAQDAIRVAKLV